MVATSLKLSLSPSVFCEKGALCVLEDGRRHLELRQDGYDETEDVQSPRGLYQGVRNTSKGGRGRSNCSGKADWWEAWPQDPAYPIDLWCLASLCAHMRIHQQISDALQVAATIFLPLWSPDAQLSPLCITSITPVTVSQYLSNLLRLPSPGQAEGTTCPRSVCIPLQQSQEPK